MAGRLDDGHSTTISFSILVPATAAGGTGTKQVGGYHLWEKEVMPPGLDGGEGNPTTTMRNNVLRTFAPKKLKTATPMECVISYDPAVLNDFYRMVNVNQQVRTFFPDGSYWEFFAFVRSFKPNKVKEGEQPIADLTIEPSNFSTQDTKVFPGVTLNPPHNGRVPVERSPSYGEVAQAVTGGYNGDPNRPVSG